MDSRNRKTLVWDNIPEWAIYALEYGIEEELFLNEEDKDMIARFIEENFPGGYTMNVDWKSCREFDSHPAFGKPCKTYRVIFNVCIYNHRTTKTNQKYPSVNL